MKVVHATLFAPNIPIELTAQCAVAIHKHTRQQLHARAKRFKQQARRYLARRYERTKASGYQTGITEGKAEFGKLTHDIVACYQHASEIAAQESRKLALLLADQVVESHITEHPESLVHWFNRATTILRAEGNLALLVHPRLHKSVLEIQHLLPAGLRLEINSAPAAPDFTLTCNSGAVEFSWREALETLAANGAAEKR
jgi:flagellar biosynthesis/type III secretory pathway protein FliH